MPNTKSHRRGVQEPSRRAKLSEKSSSFHGGIPATMQTDQKELRRPKTLPDLLQDRSFVCLSPESRPKKLTKLLLNVTVQGSVGALHVIMSPENTVADLAAAAVKQYIKECRRPILPTTDPSGFDLHYSQFCLESKSHIKPFYLLPLICMLRNIRTRVWWRLMDLKIIYFCFV